MKPGSIFLIVIRDLKVKHLVQGASEMRLKQLKQYGECVKEVKTNLNQTKQDLVKMMSTFSTEFSNANELIKKKIEQTLLRSDIAVVLMQQVEYIQDKYQRELLLRKKLQNELIEERGNIRVFSRIRPFIPIDNSTETNLNVIDDNNLMIAFKPGTQHRGSKMKQFELDRVYSMDVSQDAVFEDVKPLLSSVLDGYNVCILAYGQTGSGKTYTMEGTVDQPGVIPRAIKELFTQMNDKSQTHQFKITMSMIEVYNNEVRDLLDGVRQSADSQVRKRSTKRILDVIDSGEGGLQVKEATVLDVTDANQVEKYMRRGSWNRSEANTLMNNHSSRSHSIVTIEVETRQTDHARTILGFSIPGTKAKLRLVDLAGSECVGMSGVTGDQAKEASYVNRSLAALGDVMAALSQQNRSHIPYRNSRLTHLLQDSLGGDAKMLVLVCVSPTVKCAVETAHALSFGSRVRFVTRSSPLKRHVVY